MLKIKHKYLINKDLFVIFWLILNLVDHELMTRCHHVNDILSRQKLIETFCHNVRYTRYY